MIIDTHIGKLSVAISYTIVTLHMRYPSTINHQNQQDVGYYSPEARTWINLSCDLRSMTSSYFWTPAKGSDRNSLCQLFLNFMDLALCSRLLSDHFQQELAKYSGQYPALVHDRDSCMKLAEEARQLGDHWVEEAHREGGNTLSCVFSLSFMVLHRLVTSAAALDENPTDWYSVRHFCSRCVGELLQGV
jgi:hypothetical protein